MAKNSFAGELLHVNAVRMRVLGSGNLEVYLNSLDDTNTQQIESIAMSSSTNKEPLQLANFIDQRVKIRLKTTEKDEKFYVTSITIFVAPLFMEYPR